MSDVLKNSKETSAAGAVSEGWAAVGDEVRKLTGSLLGFYRSF